MAAVYATCAVLDDMPTASGINGSITAMRAVEGYTNDQILDVLKGADKTCPWHSAILTAAINELGGCVDGLKRTSRDSGITYTCSGNRWHEGPTLIPAR
jgi:hypothetical protein